MECTAAQVEWLAGRLGADPLLAAAAGTAWLDFQPRPNRPERFDQQSAFYHSRDQVAFLLGGNGSGKTEAAAGKLSKFLLRDQPPPRKDTPFWIVSNTYDQVCAVCWAEKLHGRQHIPDCEVDWPRVRWLNSALGWPLSVPLKPWPDRPEANWLLEFRSYEQGRRHLQARSIGGFWLSEQFTWDVFQEVLRGCRDYMFPGGQIAEFTPVDPELCIELERVFDEKPAGWGFYRLNTECNRENLGEGWLENFKAAVPEEMLATRLTGALAVYEGVIFQTFNPAVHVVEDAGCGQSGRIFCGIDWGASAEHPLVCLWGHRDPKGDWLIFDEYWSNRQDVTLEDHYRAIAERTAEWQVEPEMYADTENALAVAQFGQWGANILGAQKDVLDSIDVIRSLLKVQPATGRPRLLISRRCTHLIQEMRKYRWDSKARAAGSLCRARPLKRDDDCVDALRYMVYSVEKSLGQAPGSMTWRHNGRRHGVRFARTR